MTPPLYLDYNATTPIDPRVLEAMLPWLRRDTAIQIAARLFAAQGL